MVCKLLVFALLCFTFSGGTDITFKNVTIVYSWHGELPVKRIPSSNSLKDFLPVGLEKIYIKVQRIPVLYKDALADLVNLDELAIEYSQVGEIRPSALKNVQTKTFSLKGNVLEEIREGVFNNVKVYHLNLRNNKISSIEIGAFDNMTELVTIYLGNNNIRAWNKNWFQNTPTIRDVGMEYNIIEELPQEAFKNFKWLQSENSEAYLDFDHNKIKTIHPDAFKGIYRIQILHLENNHLENFDGNCLNNVQIFELHIDNNSIVCLEGDYEIIFKADRTYMDGNPFDCECLNKIKIWANENKRFVDYKNVEICCSNKTRKL